MRALIIFILGLIFISFPSFAYGQQTETIIPRSSNFCTDFEINYHTESSQTGQGANSSETKGLKEYTGSLTLQNLSFPTFPGLIETLELSLERHLETTGQSLLFPEISLDETPLLSKAKHFVTGLDEEGKPTESEITPETTVVQPGWFTKLLSLTRIFCAINGSCPSTSYNIKVAQPDIGKAKLSTKGTCPIGAYVSGESVSLTSPERGFKVESLTTTSKTPTSTGETIITEQASLKNQTRGLLVGGKTLALQSSFLAGQLSPDVAAGSGPLLSDTAYLLESPYVAKSGSETMNYQALAALRKNFCLAECSLYPPDTDITSLYSFCPSCNADDYPTPFSIYDDTSLDKSFCQMEQGACGYYSYDQATYEGCGEMKDPVCESDKCNPYEYGQAIDYINHGCPLPYNATDCTDPNVCQLVLFPANPEGGFGYCQYHNTDVCIRVDRSETGSCAAVCNRACCPSR